MVGIAFVLGQALAVGAFGVIQYMCLRTQAAPRPRSGPIVGAADQSGPAILRLMCSTGFPSLLLMRAHLHNRQRLQHCHSVAFRVTNGHI